VKDLNYITLANLNFSFAKVPETNEKGGVESTPPLKSFFVAHAY
jgi:hypothetical protein